MPKLVLKRDRKSVAKQLIEAKGLLQRIRGLTTYSSLPEEAAFFLPSCPSIHTFFMRFSIDVIFVDRNFRILSLFENVPSKRILFGGWRSRHVFEMRAGRVSALQLKKGDLLNVEP